MDKERFKEDLRGKIHDFSTTCALINLSDTKPKGKKEKEVEEKYLKLENWILNQILDQKDLKASPVLMPEEEDEFHVDNPPMIDGDQTELGF